MKYYVLMLAVLVMGLCCSCTEDDPEESQGGDTEERDSETGSETATETDSGSDSETDTVTDSTDASGENCLEDAYDAYSEDVSSCAPAATDYQPRNAGADGWDACISDDNVYHRIEESISSIARVEAYSAVGDLLWNNPDIPSVQDFIDARILLDAEEGLGSRLDRRYDVHYDAPADGSKCDEEEVPSQYPDYCVGPATLRPAISAAFVDGANGTKPLVSAEIIHAALQWFLYVSPSKEATTCADKAKDCDSSWAYYTGGRDRGQTIGLSEEIMALSPETDNRAYDGALAVRCWRDLDSADTAANLELRDRAISQYDNALIHGMSLLVRQRFVALGECADQEQKSAAHEALKLLVPLFDRETRERDAGVADTLKAEIAKEISAVDTAAAVAAIDSVYLCP